MCLSLFSQSIYGLGIHFETFSQTWNAHFNHFKNFTLEFIYFSFLLFTLWFKWMCANIKKFVCHFSFKFRFLFLCNFILIYFIIWQFLFWFYKLFLAFLHGKMKFQLRATMLWNRKSVFIFGNAYIWFANIEEKLINKVEKKSCQNDGNEWNIHSKTKTHTYRERIFGNKV